MSQKFIGLDDAANKLGVTKDRLNQLREAGDLRAYRDGSSWKFRTEDIDKLESEGIPADDSASLSDFSLTLDDDDMTLSAEEDAGPPTPEPTSVGADSTSDDDIGLGVEPLGDGDDAESILLTGDEQPEGGMPRPQSTIIGKSELSLEDDLMPASGGEGGPKSGGSFAELEELELDLDAESSRVMGAQDVEAAAEAAKAADSGPLGLESDLELDLIGSDVGSGPDVLSGKDPSADDAALSGAPGSVAGLSGLDAIDLAADEDDDLVLGGSDDGAVGSGDSGINLSPSDSGFALDEVPLDLGGSQIGSALDLASLSVAGSGVGLGAEASSAGGEDFQLTPADSDDANEDSSQIVALEDVGEEEDLPGFEAVEEEDDEGGFDEGFGGGLSAEPAGAPAVAVASAQDVAFPGWIIGLLMLGFFAMLLCGTMAIDLVRSMWAWEEPYALNSGVMDGINGIFGN